MAPETATGQDAGQSLGVAAPAAPEPGGELARLGPGGAGLVLIGEQSVPIGGSERVHDAILGRFPQARALALGIRGPYSEVRESGRARTLGRDGPTRHFLAPLYARRLSRLDPGEAAVVLSLCTHGWSLASRIPPGARHLAYACGSAPSLYPPRSEDYVGGYARPLRPLIRVARPALRAHNRRLMQRPDRLLANSRWSERRIAAAYGRRADVLHPPVDTEFFTPSGAEREGLLTVSRLAPQKRVQVAVEAARVAGEKLVVVGGGGMLEDWRRRAPAGVTFTGMISDRELRERYRSAKALICPTVEEFGIVMAEAHACGTPVIAPAAGGALEIVDDRRTGILLQRSDPDAIAAAVRRLDSQPPDPVACRRSAERFSERRFLAGLERVLAEELAAAVP